MRTLCAVCNKEVATNEGSVYWVYDRNRGHEIAKHVCGCCDLHPEHAMMVVGKVASVPAKK